MFAQCFNKLYVFYLKSRKTCISWYWSSLLLVGLHDVVVNVFCRYDDLRVRTTRNSLVRSSCNGCTFFRSAWTSLRFWSEGQENTHMFILTISFSRGLARCCGQRVLQIRRSASNCGKAWAITISLSCYLSGFYSAPWRSKNQLHMAYDPNMVSSWLQNGVKITPTWFIYIFENSSIRSCICAKAEITGILAQRTLTIMWWFRQAIFCISTFFSIKEKRDASLYVYEQTRW